MEEILQHLSAEVKTRRIILYPYFKDLDRVSELVINYLILAQSYRTLFIHVTHCDHED